MALSFSKASISFFVCSYDAVRAPICSSAFIVTAETSFLDCFPIALFSRLASWRVKSYATFFYPFTTLFMSCCKCTLSNNAWTCVGFSAINYPCSARFFTFNFSIISSIRAIPPSPA